MIQLIKRPEVNDTDLPLLSRWQSNRLPYIFEFQRTDSIILSIVPHFTGNIQVQVPIPIANGLAIINSTLTIYSANGLYNGVTGTLKSVGNIGSSYYLITDIPYIGSDTGGYIIANARELYRAYVKLVGITPTTNQEIELGTLYGTPQANGLVKMDVKALLTYAMQKQNLFTFNVRNLKDIYSYLSFKLYYNAGYNIGINSYKEFTTDKLDSNGNTAITYYAIDGVKNILEQYGQNFADYLTTPKQREVKFLTEFQTPTKFIGFPFALNWIFNKDLSAGKTNITLEEDEYDATGNNTNHYDEIINKSESGGVNHLLLTGNYTTGTEYIEAWIEANGTAGEYYVAENYVADFYTDDVLNSSGASIRVTEKKKVYIDTRCRKNPVYLMWKNSLGGWDYWLFDNNTEENYLAKHNTDYSLYVENIETTNVKSKFVIADQVKTITCGDSVSISSIKGIAGIEKSPQVFMLHDATKLTTNPSLAWIGVNVAPKGFKYSPLADRVDVEVTFELPNFYTIPN
jgi:hypothetical protein